MNYYFPNYYHSFQCIGGQCPDTCCGGWNIDIDTSSLNHYRRLIKSQQNPIAPANQASHRDSDPFIHKLEQSIDFRHRTFRLKDRYCPLLTGDGLCGLYLHVSKDSMCRTCRTYPRHQEEFGNIREISLSLSCPEAARIILSQPGRPHMLSKKTERLCPKDQEVDEALLSWLMDAREILLDIIWRPLPLNVSVSMALAFSHDLQLRHAQRRFFEDGRFHLEKASEALNTLAEKYLAPDAADHFDRQFQKRVSPGCHSANIIWQSALCNLYASLEPVLENWRELMNRCLQTLRSNGYPHLSVYSHNSIWERQLLTYFIQVYFPGAIYDDELFGKMQFAAISWLIICILSHSLEHPGDTPWIQAAYLYSRQVENSDTNLGILFHACSTCKDFRLSQLLYALYMA